MSYDDEDPEEVETLRTSIADRLLALVDTEPDLVQFMMGIAKETPRGAILVCAEYADMMLKRLLTKACLTPTLAGQLLDTFNAPLGSFSTRILAAYALGLLPEDEHWNLQQLRKVRNHCAHHFGPITYDDPKVRSHIANLRAPAGYEDDPPHGKLATTVASLRSWLLRVEPELERRDPHRLPALAATRGPVPGPDDLVEGDMRTLPPMPDRNR